MERQNKIMIVDDTTFMISLIRRIVVKMGYHVVAEAKDGEEALRKLPISRPDIIILDIEMPNMNGLEFLKNINEKYPETKVIICSSHSNIKNVKEAAYYGVSDFIVKPIHEVRMILAIENAAKEDKTVN